MKRWLLLVVLVVGLSAAGTVALQYLPDSSASERLVITATAAAEEAGPKPKAELSEATTFEFGTLPQRTTGKHSWKVKNTGQGDLKLWMIDSTCSCTLAKFKDGAAAVVKPGEETTIDLEYETRENNGEYQKGATIGTNDPDRASFFLGVHGKVFPAVMTFPSEAVLSFGSLSNDEEDHVFNLAVFSKDRPDTKVTKVTASNPNVVVTHQPLTATEAKSIPTMPVEKGERLKINVKSGMPLGLFREEVVVETDHPNMPKLSVALSGKMFGPINLQPGALVMHDVYGKAGGTGELAIVVRGNRVTKFEIARKPEKLQVEIAPGADNKPGRYRLVVKVPPDSPPEKLEEEIVLKTDHPKASTVVVPVSIWVLSSN